MSMADPSAMRRLIVVSLVCIAALCVGCGKKTMKIATPIDGGARLAEETTVFLEAEDDIDVRETEEWPFFGEVSHEITTDGGTEELQEDVLDQDAEVETNEDFDIEIYEEPLPDDLV